MDYRGRHVTVMGLGHFGGGLAAALYLAGQGALVTVTDLADEAALAGSLAKLQGASLAALHLGGHRDEDFRHADLVVVNPAVRPGNPWLELARQSGATLATEIELFMESCPAAMVGVTGSNGKSTTAAMIAAIGRAESRRTWLGGNIGGSLLGQLARMAAEDWVVLELSSFQLWHMGARARMPQVAVVTSITPNHLDWHASMDDYIHAKQRLLTGQQAGDSAVLNTFDPELAAWSRSEVPGQGESLIRGRQVPPVPLDRLPPLQVPGYHNRINAACAAAAALASGCSEASVYKGLAEFVGLPQRLERFAVIGGRSFYNDSTSTTPESTVAALDALEGPVWLLAGGKDKGFDFAAMIEAVGRHALGAAFFGTVAPQLRRALAARFPEIPAVAVETMEEALEWCWQHSKPTETILLSPGCSSHDQFQNFRHRGECFVQAVSKLALSGPLML